MNRIITKFLRNWSPWHLRKRVAELRHDLDHLTDVRDDFLSAANQHVVKENEELKK